LDISQYPKCRSASRVFILILIIKAMLKKITFKNLIIYILAIFVVVVVISLLRISNAFLEETKRNNTFQRRLDYENSIIQFDIMCNELGKLSDAHNDYYFDMSLRRCVPDISTGNLSEDLKLTTIITNRYRGVISNDAVENYYLFFHEFIKPEKQR